MAESSIARTSIKVTTDATAVKPGLDKMGGDLRAWAAKQQQALGGMFSAALRGGLIGGLAGGSLQSIVEGVAGKIGDWAAGFAGLESALAATQRTLAAIEESMARSRKLAEEWRGAMTSPEDKLASLNAQIEREGTAFTTLENDRKAALRELRALQEKTWEGFGRFLLGRDEDAQNKARERVKEFDKPLKGIADKLRDLREQRDRLLNPAEDPKVMGDFNRALAEQWERVATIEMSPVEKMVRGFEKLGVPPDFLDELRRAADLAAQAEHDAKNWMLALQPPPWLMMGLNAAGVAAGAIKNLPATRTDNPALIKGTAAEVSARTRHEFGSKAAEQLAAARQANDHLKAIQEGVAVVGQKIGAGVALLPF